MVAVTLMFGCSAGLPEGQPETTTPASLDLSALTASLQAHVDRDELPGARLLVVREGAVVGDVLVGYSDLESRTPLTDRSIFRLASATKVFVSVAFLTLVDEGRIQISDPVSRYLPEFAEMAVFDGEGTSRPASNPLTVLDLLRHTGGMGYGYEEPYRTALVDAGLLQTGVRFDMDWSHPWSLSDWGARLAEIPLEAEPGKVFSYGLHHDVLGLIIERISGQRLDDFVSERLLAPLGLGDSGFSVRADQVSALTSFYSFENDALVRVEGERRAPSSPRPGPRPGAAGGICWAMVA